MGHTTFRLQGTTSESPSLKKLVVKVFLQVLPVTADKKWHQCYKHC